MHRSDSERLKRLRQQVESLDEAAQSWGWQNDQGSDSDAIGKSYREREAAKAALEKEFVRLERRLARLTALLERQVSAGPRERRPFFPGGGR